MSEGSDAGQRNSLLGNYRPQVSAFPRDEARQPVSSTTLMWVIGLSALLALVALQRLRRRVPPAEKSEPWPDVTMREWALLMTYCAAAAAAFLLPSYWRYTNYGIDTWDFGIYTQSFWNALTGQGMFNSPEGMDHLSGHASPGLYLLLPAYALAPNGLTLLVLNGLAIVAGIIPAYLLARRRLGVGLSLCCVAVYLTNPALRSLNCDVHEVTFAMPLLLWGFYFIQLGHTWPALVALLLAMLFKEDIGVLVSVCGIYVVIAQRRFHFGIALMLMGALWVIVGTGVIIPFFGGSHASAYFDRYRALGDTWAELVFAPLLRPRALLSIVTASSTRSYLAMILAPFAFLPLLAPAEWLFALAPIAENVLARDAVMRSGIYHYEALLLPGLYVAFVAALTRGWTWIEGRASPSQFGRQKAKTIVTALVTIALIALIAINVRRDGVVGRPLLLGIDGDPARAELDAIVARVPPSLSLVSPQNVQPHLSNRLVSAYLNNVDDFSDSHPPFAYAVLPTAADPPPPTYDLVWKGNAYALYHLR